MSLYLCELCNKKCICKYCKENRYISSTGRCDPNPFGCNPISKCVDYKKEVK